MITVHPQTAGCPGHWFTVPIYIGDTDLFWCRARGIEQDCHEWADIIHGDLAVTVAVADCAGGGWTGITHVAHKGAMLQPRRFCHRPNSPVPQGKYRAGQAA